MVRSAVVGVGQEAAGRAGFDPPPAPGPDDGSGSHPEIVAHPVETGSGRRVGEQTPAVSPEVLRARAYLSRVAEPPAPALAALVDEVGPVEAAARVRAGRVDERVVAETSARRAAHRPDADLAAAAAAGVRLVTPEHGEWPAEAFEAFAVAGTAELTTPLALWARGPGRLDELCARAVAMVGSRAATPYGLRMAGELGAGVAERGWTLVSGGAVGIDGAAHRGALAVRGLTIAVLACGADRSYPRAHAELLERIATTALVLSEYPPGGVPARHRFLVRNRIIAALAAGTVVVEAGLRSGAQRTASDAIALGRDVLAVPGPVSSATSAGCHGLIRDGAVLVTRTEEVLEAVGRLGVDLADPVRSDTVHPTDRLSPAAALVHDALPARAARDTRWLAMEAGIPLDGVRAALTELERCGLVQRFGGFWQRVSTGRG